MTELEVRGFLTIGCSECPFIETITSGYDHECVDGYICRLYKRRLDDQNGRAIKDLPESFPRFCRLKRINDLSATEHQKLKRVVAELKLIQQILEDK
jgi:hypothetical protein